MMDRQGQARLIASIEKEHETARRESTLAAAAPCFCPSAPAHPFNHSSQLVLPPAHTGPRPPPHQATTATAEISHPHEGRRSDVEQLMHRFRGDSFRPSMECMLDGSDTALSHELRFLAPWFWIAHTSLSSYYPFMQEVPQCRNWLPCGGQPESNEAGGIIRVIIGSHQQRRDTQD